MKRRTLFSLVPILKISPEKVKLTKITERQYLLDRYCSDVVIVGDRKIIRKDIVNNYTISN